MDITRRAFIKSVAAISVGLSLLDFRQKPNILEAEQAKKREVFGVVYGTAVHEGDLVCLGNDGKVYPWNGPPNYVKASGIWTENGVVTKGRFVL